MEGPLSAKKIITPQEYQAEEASHGVLPGDLQQQPATSVKWVQEQVRKSWFKSYQHDMMGPELDPDLDAAVREYESRPKHETSSNQAKEELARLKEENAAAVKQFQWLDPADYADEEARMEKIMSAADLITMLRDQCHLKCWYGEPVRRYMALRIQTVQDQLPEYACWVQEGAMPEFSMMHFDDKGVPLNEKYRGWRTVLLQLVIKGFLTEELVTKVFGPATGPAATRYNMQLAGFRNRPRQGE